MSIKIIKLFNMQIRLFFSIILSTILLQSCTFNNGSKTENTLQTSDSVSQKENFITGQIINKVVNLNDASQNYSLYLPKAYSKKSSWPVIFIFDAHGDGNLPITKYKDLAEEYGFILAGSNNSKNGTSWEESQAIGLKLFSDVESRLSINNQRIYALGFSGGARIANGLLLNNGSIAGVICCGASAPAANSNIERSNYSFIGLVGNEDFNYTEMKKYDMVDLAGHNVKHSLITFEGKHEWPSEKTMEEAFWWLTLNEMRKDIPKKNDALIAKHLEAINNQMQIIQQKKQTIDAYNLCIKTINFYNGLSDLTYYFDIYKSIEKAPEIDKYKKQEEADWKQEEELKQFYIKAIQTQDFTWWKKELVSLNQKTKTEKNKNKVFIYKRTLSYLSLVAYMQASGALKQNEINAADFFCKIYVLVDPTNSEAYYLTASLDIKKGNTNDAINAFKNAINNGFTDISRLQNDSAFIELKKNPEFLKLVEEIKK